MPRMTRISTLGRRFNPPEITPASILRAEEWQREEERRKAMETWQRHLRESGIPKRYRQVSLKACPPEVRAYAEGFTKQTERWLLLCGGCGAGKTTAACAVAIQAAKTCTVRFVSVPDLVTQATDFKQRGEFDAYCDCRLLVLDDLGKERGTEFAIGEVYRIIDHRNGARKPTIVTTNFDAKGLARHFGDAFGKEMAEALISRIQHDCETVQMDGADWRLQKPR